jgi:hypothetical protein
VREKYNKIRRRAKKKKRNGMIAFINVEKKKISEGTSLRR